MAETDIESTSKPLHLAVIGGGIAGCAAASWAAAHGARVTLFNAGLPLGGSCIHVGTFPARLLMSAATDHHRSLHPRFDGIQTNAETPDWKSLQAMRRQRSDELRGHYQQFFSEHPNVELVHGRATFSDQETIYGDHRHFKPDRVLLTPGSHSLWPDISGIQDVTPLTFRTLGELSKLPESIVLLESNDVAIAYAQLLTRLGSQVTILTRRPRLLQEEHGPDIESAMTQLVEDDGIGVATDVELTEVSSHGDGVRLVGTRSSHPAHWDAESYLVVDHRQPRIEELGLDRANVELTEQGFIVIDETLQTTNPRIFAAGDAIGRNSHAYAEAYDAILAARNAILPSRTAGHSTAIPFTIYSDPQFAGVGWNEVLAKRSGFETDASTYPLEHLPAAHALGCTRGFIKLIRDRRSDHLVGARILAPHASELIMELALAVRYGLTISELATMIHPPISLGEAIARAARAFIES